MYGQAPGRLADILVEEEPRGATGAPSLGRLLSPRCQGRNLPDIVRNHISIVVASHQNLLFPKVSGNDVIDGMRSDGIDAAANGNRLLTRGSIYLQVRMSGYRLFRYASGDIDKDVALVGDKVELSSDSSLAGAIVRRKRLSQPMRTYIVSLRQRSQVVPIALHARDQPVDGILRMPVILSIDIRPIERRLHALRVHSQRRSFSISNRALGIIAKLSFRRSITCQPFRLSNPTAARSSPDRISVTDEPQWKTYSIGRCLHIASPHGNGAEARGRQFARMAIHGG